MPFVRQLLAALRMMLVLTLVLGVLYPALVWGLVRGVARDQADGSLTTRDGQVIGSSLLGQAVTDPALFHPRPSVNEYAGGVSGGSNLAESSQDQATAVAERRAAYAEIAVGEPTGDALTASASGLDPHISPAFAKAQVTRVAAAAGLDRSVVARLVEDHTAGRQLGFLGEPRVNVLELNLALRDLKRPGTIKP
ncbi:MULTISPECIES: K(+)-transporting ATPase subunit C [unclassified Knoellia]|uniref:K(+)-transporting ATPase subunit C n=1 Tax=Knoellia altitudinis TaxID=3404795 RepID=UPI003621797F